MKPALSYIGLKLIILLFLFLPVKVLSLSDTTGRSDTALSSSRDSTNALYAGLGYGSNMIYLGSTISRNQPFGYSNITWGLNNELFLSGSAYHLADLNPFLAFYSLSLSYNHVFSSWFDISLGLYRYQVAKNLVDTLFSNFTYGNITFGIDWKLIYSQISAGGLFADQTQGYFQLKNSRYFQTPDLLKGKANVSFDPYINLLFGSLTKARTSTDTTYTVTAPYRPWGSNTKISTSTSTSYSRIFNLFEIEFGLPVAFNTDFMTIEAEIGYVLPTYSDKDYPGPEGFIFLLSGFFRIF